MAAIVDTKILPKPDKYRNQKSEWPEFHFSLKTYVGAISEQLLAAMTDAERQEGVILTASLDEAHVQMARTLMFILSASLEGSSKRLIMNVEGHNGLEAWRLLCRREEPTSGAVQVAQLTTILRTAFTGKLETFEDEMERLEAAIKRYEGTHTEVVSDTLVQAILKQNSPDSIRGQVELQTFQSVSMLKEALVAYTTGKLSSMSSSASTAASATPMDISAFEKGLAKGKSKGKGKKGKGKGKGGGKKGKGGEYTDQQKGASAPFAGYCNWCGKWGHRKQDCRSRPNGQQVAAVDTPATTSGTTKETTPSVGAIESAGVTAVNEWIY